jgi:hypothetical protein
MIEVQYGIEVQNVCSAVYPSMLLMQGELLLRTYKYSIPFHDVRFQRGSRFLDAHFVIVELSRFCEWPVAVAFRLH